MLLLASDVKDKNGSSCLVSLTIIFQLFPCHVTQCLEADTVVLQIEKQDKALLIDFFSCSTLYPLALVRSG